MKKIHFIGIGGTGISAIALMLLERGYKISGTDLVASRYFKAVTDQGAITQLGHRPELALQADLIIRSSAVKDDDPEVVAAKKAGIPVLKRAEFLQELTAGKLTLAIAGSHGKTTTTAMLVTALQALGQDPSYILGADIKGIGANAHVGSGEHFVIEADEYDYMFLGLAPHISVITNIEFDHPDFFHTPEKYIAAFAEFVKKTLPGGKVLVCSDDDGNNAMLNAYQFSDISILTYGFSEHCNYQIYDCVLLSNGYSFKLRFNTSSNETRELGNYNLVLPGRHNVLNAVASLAVVDQLELNPADTALALGSFLGTERRFDVVYNRKGVVIANDYGHHPTQIDLTLSAAKERYPQKTLWAVWEPHTFSRTQLMQDRFAQSLSKADQVVILKIYAAREADKNFTPQIIIDALSHQDGRYLPEFEQAAEYIAQKTTSNDIILVLSAGKGPEFSNLLSQKIEQLKEDQE